MSTGHGETSPGTHWRDMLAHARLHVPAINIAGQQSFCAGMTAALKEAHLLLPYDAAVTHPELNLLQDALLMTKLASHS